MNRMAPLLIQAAGQRQLIFFVLWTLLVPALCVAATPADAIAVTVEIRLADGRSATGEQLHLQPFLAATAGSDNDTVACVTDGEGRCQWHVPQGLYQLLLPYPLDPLSRLAVAEGGLRGLGITVGATAVTYHLTLQPNDRVYFDAAPQAAQPVPIVPTLADIQHHTLSLASGQFPVATRSAAVDEDTTRATVAPLSDGLTTADPQPSQSSGQTQKPYRTLARFVVGGLVSGALLVLWQRRYLFKIRKGDNRA